MVAPRGLLRPVGLTCQRFTRISMRSCSVHRVTSRGLRQLDSILELTAAWLRQPTPVLVGRCSTEAAPASSETDRLPQFCFGRSTSEDTVRQIIFTRTALPKTWA